MNNLFVFIFGLVIGSFLNVVISRLGAKKSFWSGRSFCPHCHKPIYWYDNIPLLSFIILGGKCRSCHKKISWQYPAIELATGLIFLLLFGYFGLSAKFFIYVIFSTFLIVIFVYDLKHYLILDRVSIPAMVVAFLASLYLGVNPASLILGVIIGGGFFAVQFFISGGKWVGDGDIRLGALMGLMLGLKFLLLALFFAYLMGSVVGLALIVFGRKKMSSALPFGPFLTLATFITLLFGQKILNWYLNFLYY